MIRQFALLGALLAAALGAAEAREVDAAAEAIVSAAYRATRYAGDDGRSQARMLIRDAQGNQQQRQFVILRRDVEDGGNQDFLVVFDRPADVRGTVLLVNKQTERDDDRWLYLPALDLDKRISAGDKRTSFVGSDFFYEDISGRNPALDWHQLISNDGKQAVIKCEPKEPSSVEFAYALATIDLSTHLPVKAEYFDAEGKPLRSIETLATALVQGHPTVIRSKVSNHLTGGYTLLEMRNPQYDIGLEAELFTPRSLRNPPRQWLKAGAD
ncbi:outer membrane lipoprotein-sorting protein [Pseudomarimonas arenosa]|uniref:Outer membrane lipoprotein-sorting protein n=1 Tax=Pseudomarimonas arenosa TaxID=2774145 RepID=A0AAW3ZIJ1_9GAMM|nr:outer membrane lipoprotein-sorting protein [Pseudomarimonas arenosa]MBD8525245.1 outer membrane lipoprotein-sorting protein [Pseudomarimonas arenosa]